MRRHHLLERAAPADLIAVSSRICGLHAQLTSSAELSVWARIEGLAPGALEAALWQERTLVKLWAMRGTLHLLPAAELGTWIAAFRTYTDYGNARPAARELAGAVRTALEHGPLTREELAAEVGRLTGSRNTAERMRGSWGTALKPASFRGELCFAPAAGRRVRFTTPRRWVPGGVHGPEPAAATLEVTRRFLAGYAPARVEDLARWWGVGASAARRMLAALGSAAVEVDIEGGRAWMLAEHLGEASSTAPARAARLLPSFDQWVVGASRSSPAMLAKTHRAKVYRRQGWISPVMLVGGRIEGVWTHRRTARRLTLELMPFVPLPRWARTQIEAEAERLARFMGGPLVLRWR